MPLLDNFCDKCIWNYVPQHTKLADLEENFGTCDNCGRETKLYGLPSTKTLSNWLTVSLNIQVFCIVCNKQLKIVEDRKNDFDPQIIVERHICEEASS